MVRSTYSIFSTLVPLINLSNIKNYGENSWERRKWSPELLGEEHECYLCAMSPQVLLFIPTGCIVGDRDCTTTRGGRFDIAHLPLSKIEIWTHASGTRSSQAVFHLSTILAQMLQNFSVWISTGVLSIVRPLAGVKLTFPLHFFFTKHSSNCNKSLIGVECWKKAHGEKNTASWKLLLHFQLSIKNWWPQHLMDAHQWRHWTAQTRLLSIKITQSLKFAFSSLVGLK